MDKISKPYNELLPTLFVVCFRSIAATDHEPTDARKSFPCFDEPNKKATYNISIIHQDVYQALSNMPMQVCISQLLPKTSSVELLKGNVGCQVLHVHRLYHSGTVKLTVNKHSMNRTGSPVQTQSGLPAHNRAAQRQIQSKNETSVVSQLTLCSDILGEHPLLTINSY